MNADILVIGIAIIAFGATFFVFFKDNFGSNETQQPMNEEKQKENSSFTDASSKNKKH